MINKDELEKMLLRDDIVEYISSLSKEEINDMLGEKISRMKGFEQKNIHHCYDLLGHTLHTIDSISKDDISQDDLKKLKVAALFHDVAKPDVARFNPKTGQQVFYGHAEKSEILSKDILKNFGYNDKEIKNIGFYIKHHDDFISYKSSIEDYMKTHEYIREINSNTVAEKILENKYDFQKMGLDKDQIRYVCYFFARGEEPKFTSPRGIIDIEVDLEDVKEKMGSQQYMNEYIPTKEDYKLLLNLCKADAKAQTELYEKNGKVMCSRKEKLDNMNNIESSLEDAYRRVEEISYNIKIDNEIIDDIVNCEKENRKLTQNEKDAASLYIEYRDILTKEKNKHKEIGESYDRK